MCYVTDLHERFICLIGLHIHSLNKRESNKINTFKFSLYCVLIPMNWQVTI